MQRGTWLTKTLVAGAVVLGGAALGVMPAGAAAPAVQGCVGSSLSALATNQAGPGAFGHAVVSFAQAPDARPGLGDGIQQLQAGQVPDQVVPNTCNG